MLGRLCNTIGAVVLVSATGDTNTPEYVVQVREAEKRVLTADDMAIFQIAPFGVVPSFSFCILETL